MPELEVLRERLGPLLSGREVAAVEVSPRHGFMLRVTPDDLTGALTGRPIDGMWRRGKFLVLDSGGNHLVINPMLGGRLQYAPAGERVAAATVFRLHGRGGEACPRCGHRISELTAQQRVTSFCRGCQT